MVELNIFNLSIHLFLLKNILTSLEIGGEIYHNVVNM